MMVPWDRFGGASVADIGRGMSRPPGNTNMPSLQCGTSHLTRLIVAYTVYIASLVAWVEKAWAFTRTFAYRSLADASSCPCGPC